MKVNITLSKPLNGYLNLNPLAQPSDTEQVQADPTNTDAFLDHNEVSEMLCLEVLDYIPLFLRQKCLTGWLNKIAHGGTITLSALDVNEVARQIQNGSLNDVVEINRILYGSGQNVWMIKKSWIPIDHSIQMITQGGQFDITSVKTEGFFYYISARRK